MEHLPAFLLFWHAQTNTAMSVNLCIDWGNTRVKAAIFNDAGVAEKQSFAPAEAAAGIEGLISRHTPSKGILCAVSGKTEDVAQTLRENLKHFIKLDSHTSLPIINAYSSPDTLGSDRLAMAVAAQGLYPNSNCLVISAGTCITYNFIQKNGTFRGGAISPGLHMRLKAMHHFTSRLPEVPLEGETLLLGYDTETAMRSGAVYGMAAEIDGMVTDFERQYPDFNAILTGGDAAFFGSKLKSKIFADPDLLLKGLNLIVKHNVPY